jgi:hypothetical protein
MHAWSQSLLIGHSTKEVGEDRALFCAQRYQERLLMVARELADGLERFCSLACQVQGVASPVGGIRAAVDHPALLKLIEESHQPARQDAEMARQRLLADSSRAAYTPKNACVGRRKVERVQPFCEFRSGMRAKLCEKKCGRVSAPRRGRAMAGARCRTAHVDNIVTLDNDS